MSKSGNPLVSIIIPVYNVEKYLKQCVESVLAQTYTKLEIILVDDGSLDKSGDICDVLANIDTRVKVVHKNNEGLNFARKTGFEHSTGEWITFIDSDDAVDARYVEALLSANIRCNTEISICAFSPFVNEPVRDNMDVEDRLENVEDITRLYLTDSRPEGRYFLQTAWAKLFSRRIIKLVDWDFSDYKSNEDELMSIYYYKNLNGGVAFVDNGMYYYRQNPDSIMAKAKVEYRNFYRGKKISKLEFLEDVYQKRLNAFGDKYSNEIAYFLSMHFMVHINREYRKDPKYLLSKKEAALYNNKLEQIIESAKKYTYHDEYQQIYEAIQKKQDINAFFKYRENNPLISIIVPLYNAELYLRECVDSLLGQSYWNIEVILVNDGSTDSSPSICEEYARKDERVRVVHKENSGVSSARNTGIIESRGAYIIFVDSDDFISPSAVDSLMVGWRTSGRRADILIGDIKPYHTIGYVDVPPKRNIPAKKPFSINDITTDEIYALLTAVNSACGKAFRKDLLTRQDLIFPEDIRIAEDLVFVVKSFFSAKQLYFIDESIYFYRTDYQNTSSAIGAVSEKKAFDFGIALKSINEFLHNHNYLKRREVRDALSSAVVAHSLYALGVTEKDSEIHKKVFCYIKEDIFKYFKITASVSLLSDTDKEKCEHILLGDYSGYLMTRLQEFRFALLNRLDAIGIAEADLAVKQSEVSSLNAKTRDLSEEIAYLKSFRGLIRTLVSKIYHRIRHILRPR